MTQKAKMSTGGLVLAGLAAFAWYKYSRMNEQEKQEMLGNLKQKGQKLYDEYVPQNVKDMVGSKMNSGTASANSHFGQGSGYTS